MRGDRLGAQEELVGDLPVGVPVGGQFGGPTLGGSTSAALPACSSIPVITIADASRQLRNPLASLRLAVDNLSGYVEPAGRDLHDVAVVEVEEMGHVVDDMLALTAVESTTLAGRPSSSRRSSPTTPAAGGSSPRTAG